uniref:Synapsin n=1 Tax=Hofstenia miamia TaxID=442651 RepID=A0A068CJW9_HOFMI|nr:synapsin [Hofstenia miamia]
MNYLKRRFSDLGPGLLDSIATDNANQPAPSSGSKQVPVYRPSPAGSESAPSSPPSERKNIGHMQKAAPPSQTSSAAQAVGGFFTSLTQKAASVADSARGKCKILLVIDDAQTDWQKYFRGKRLFGDYDVRVEQAEFSEINVAAYSDGGVMVDMHVMRGGNKIVRSFKPDFVLIRQQPRSTTEDFRKMLICFQYGQVPSLNSWTSLYNFQDKPWVFSHLIQIQKKLGKEKFPLIEQAFYPDHKEMVITPKFPVVMKIGHAHGGVGKIKVENHENFQDLTGVVGMCHSYCTTEPLIPSKFDFRVQKIGSNFKVYMRTSSSPSWKSHMGAATVEQVNMNDTFKLWMDNVSELFEGLDICAITAVRGKDNRDYIIEMNDCCMPLIGDKVEEDRRLIAELICRKMETHCRTSDSRGFLNQLADNISNAVPLSNHQPANQQPQQVKPTPPQAQTSPVRPQAPTRQTSVPSSPVPNQNMAEEKKAANAAAAAAGAQNQPPNMAHHVPKSPPEGVRPPGQVRGPVMTNPRGPPGPINRPPVHQQIPPQGVPPRPGVQPPRHQMPQTRPPMNQGPRANGPAQPGQEEDVSFRKLKSAFSGIFGDSM